MHARTHARNTHMHANTHMHTHTRVNTHDIEAEDDSVLRLVYAKANLTCNSPTEIPYYTAGNDTICYHCGTENLLRDDGTYYPVCDTCWSQEKALVPKRSK